MGYAQRLERDADVDVKEAFRVLHQGLSCLAGQINATDSHSANVAARLTSNWEQLARRLGDMRMDFDESHRVLDGRLSAAERTSDYSASALDHALEKIEAFARQHAVDQAENQRQTNRHELALERLSDAFLKLEKRLPDSNLAQRLEAVERAIVQLSGQNKPDGAPLLSALQALSHRLERLEKDHGDLLSELRARLLDNTPLAKTGVEEPPAIEPPAEMPADIDCADAPNFEDLFEEAPPQPLNFLARARMAAGAVPDAPRTHRVFPVAVGFVVVLALVTGLVLHRRAERTVTVKPAVVSGPTYSVPVPPSAEDTQFVVAPQPGDDGESDFALPRPQPVGWDPAARPPALVKKPDVRNADVNSAPSGPKSVQPAPAPSIDRVQRLANQGNAQALTILGFRAVDGTNDTPVNLLDAVKYLTRAAENGQAVAQYRLGTLYERGQGVAADPAKASHWYELAAAQGNRKAMHNLAVFYASKKDMTNAARWFAKAAALGLSASEFNLAVLYERGDGVPQSPVNAFKWYSIAAAAGDIESRARVGVLEIQLNDADKAIAAKAIEAFRPLPLDHGVNVLPAADQLPPS